jgi:hypothetical protein
MERTDRVISRLEKVFGRHPFSVIFTNLFAFAFASLILWLCIAVTSDQLEWKLNILLATIGALAGWALGMFFAPYDTGEAEKFSSIGQSISVFASGYLVSKVDRFLEATLFINNIPYQLAWVRILLFVSSLMLSMLLVFTNRAYFRRDLATLSNMKKPYK